MEKNTVIALLVFGIYGLFAMWLLVGMHKQQQQEDVFLQERPKIGEELTIIVPFRNEEDRILCLLESLEKSKVKPTEILFVDDHSQDHSQAVIRAFTGKFSFRILEVNNGETGKKRAIRKAVPEVKTTFFLTLDADVHFPETYLEQVINLPNTADLYLLPVVMQGKTFLQHVYEQDVLLANALNKAVTGWNRPIMASGANLLVRKSSFLVLDSFEKHKQVASGDDQFLLHDFIQGKMHMELITNPDLAVYTETPQSLSDFFQQRLRWLRKTRTVGDFLAIRLAGLQFVITLFFWGSLICFFIYGRMLEAISLFSGRIVLDLCLFYRYFSRYGRFKTWLLLPVYELLYPIYALTLATFSRFVPLSWKGRKIQSN